jgi:hypothetical protein
MFFNTNQNRQYQFEPVPLALQDVLSSGGTTGWLHQWWGQRQADKENA